MYILYIPYARSVQMAHIHVYPPIRIMYVYQYNMLEIFSRKIYNGITMGGQTSAG